MADEQQVSTRNEARQKQQEQLQKQRDEEIRKISVILNMMAGTSEGINFFMWLFDSSGVNDPMVMSQAITSTGNVDPFLAGYAEGRRSFAAFIRSRLIPENLIKTMKRGE